MLREWHVNATLFSLFLKIPLKIYAKLPINIVRNEKLFLKGGVVMRIDAYSRVQQVYGKQTTSKLKKEKTHSFSDQLQISSMGKDIQTAKQAVLNSPDVREDVTAPIKASMDAGTYHVDSDSFAERLFEKYNSAML